MAHYSEELAEDLHTIISNDEGIYRSYLEVVENTPDPGEYGRERAVGEAIQEMFREVMGLPNDGLVPMFINEYFRQVDWWTIGKLCLQDYEDENS